MCGICGYIGRKKISEDLLSTMNNSMYHRGPNDCGTEIFESNEMHIGIAHRRLSILDLSNLGHQPMSSKSGDTVISYNGEVYNYKTIRCELEKLGYEIKSNCDTEVILYAYEQWGTECFEKFNGMFAVSIIDKKRHRLVLARDRFGKKPLYYYKHNKSFVFGSELKPLMLYSDFRKELDTASICKYFSHKYIPSPYTIFKDTFKVKPGEIVIYDYVKDQISKSIFYSIKDRFNKLSYERKKIGEAEAIKQLDELLVQSVESRLISDVPVGVMLSGGIDSTVVSAISQMLRPSAIDSFTIGFFDKEKNEADKAKSIANYLGTNHHELYMSDDDALNIMRNLVQYYDEPFSDDSQLPSMLVSKLASDNVTVALTGDGGDEVFCGYKEYDLEWIAQHMDFLGELESLMPWNDFIINRVPAELRAFINNRNSDYKAQLFSDVFAEEANKILVDKCTLNAVKHSEEVGICSKNFQERKMILDLMTYLPDEILCKMDRASMRYSLEVRCPLLDYNIVEWSFGLEHRLKYNGLNKKYILKELAYKYVPKKLLDGPKKGFSVPKARWLREVFSCEIFRMSQKDKLKKQGIFESDGIVRLINLQRTNNNVIYTSLLWSFYVFQCWYEKYIEEL